jgi:hypothetical protein
MSTIHLHQTTTSTPEEAAEDGKIHIEGTR